MLLCGRQELSVVIASQDCIGVLRMHCSGNYRLLVNEDAKGEESY
jgi:hypothetical protein